MSPSNSTPLQQLLTALPQFINRLQREGFNIGVDSYGDVHNLLLNLVAEGQLPDDFSQLRPLIAPVLCCSEQEQQRFNHYFSDWLQGLQPQIPPPIVAELKKVEQEHKTTKRSFVILALLVSLLVGLLDTPYGTYLGELISVQLFEKNHPAQPNDIVILPKPNTPKAEPVKPVQIKIIDPPLPIEIPQPTLSNLDKVKFALSACIAVLFLMLLWCLVRYKRLQRFLKRHQAEQPPDMETFFLNNQQQSLYSSVAFARTAQKLHKHREIDAHFLNVETTVKRSIQQNGFYTPVYQAIKALPEYLVLIDKAHLNDQLSQFVDTLLKQLEDFGLFIEKFYFDTDPRRCYSPRQPNKLHCLESLQSLYANHRLIIFSEASHFIDPINGKLYRWLGQLHDWQNPFLFTLDSANHWDYYQQQLHEAGFVVLAAGQKGLEELVRYISAEITAIEKNAETEADDYPILLRQSPRQFLERHAPDTETVNDLVQQLADYLQPEGFNWLAACAVYPELHWQLTLYLGKTEAQKTLDEALLLRLARLPWLRFAYMPDWLREALLSKIHKSEETSIRERLQALLLTISTQTSVDDFSLSVAKNSPLWAVMHDVLSVWHKKSSFNDTMQDYVFQSFMAERLAVKLPKLLNQRLLRFGLLEKIRLLLLLITLSATGLIGVYVNHPGPDKPHEQTLPLPVMVAIKGGYFMMGSPETELGRNPNEKQQRVYVEDFEISQYEVTQQLWQAVMGNNPSKFKGDNLPVETVSWDDVQEFIEKLNQLTGKNYRLPTEAEWEYAARAGTSTPYYWGSIASHDYANYGTEECCDGLVSGKDQWFYTSPVGSFPPNAFGLYDMAGNVWEWMCSDYVEMYNGSEKQCHNNNNPSAIRSLRSGSLDNGSAGIRSASRYRFVATNKRYVLGFRLASGAYVKTYPPLLPPEPHLSSPKTLPEITMVAIKGDCFMMGSPENEAERNQDEKQHQVCVKDFAMDQYEVSQALWQAIMGTNPSNFRGDNLPVESVSWNEIQEFIKKLNQLTGKQYRLPTEAEWEYAARAGTTTSFYTGLCINAQQANFDGNYNYNHCGKNVSKEKTVPIGSYKPNDFGLYDMAGNVWEWTCSAYVKIYDGSEMKCNDSHNSNVMMVMRGGSWYWDNRSARSARRNKLDADYHDIDVGLRLAIDVPNQSAKTITVSTPETVAIKGGCFMMGSPETEVERNPDEKQHNVCVDDFQLGQYEVTIEQYSQCVTDGGCNKPVWLKNGSKYNINTGSDDLYKTAGMSLANKDNPVTGVSWNDAMAYTQWLSNKTGKKYRLPTEVEWEYAARAGTTTAFHTGNCINTNQANFKGTQPYANCAKGEYKNQTVKVGSYSKNSFDLYDMAGNVWEWTCSNYVKNYDGSETRCSTNSNSPRVLRGGSWFNLAMDTRSANRKKFMPDNQYNLIGFRFALGQPAK